MGNNFLRLLSLVIIVILILLSVFEVYSKTYSNDIDMKTVRRIESNINSIYSRLNKTKIISLASSSTIVKIWSWLGFNVSYDGIYLTSTFDSNGYVKLDCINVVFLIRNHKEFVAYLTIKEDPTATKIIGFTIQREKISTHPPVPSDSVH